MRRSLPLIAIPVLMLSACSLLPAASEPSASEPSSTISSPDPSTAPEVSAPQGASVQSVNEACVRAEQESQARHPGVSPDSTPSTPEELVGYLDAASDGLGTEMALLEEQLTLNPSPELASTLNQMVSLEKKGLELLEASRAALSNQDVATLQERGAEFEAVITQYKAVSDSAGFTECSN